MPATPISRMQARHLFNHSTRLSNRSNIHPRTRASIPRNTTHTHSPVTRHKHSNRLTRTTRAGMASTAIINRTRCTEAALPLWTCWTGLPAG
jgi:hypothetical protein